MFYNFGKDVEAIVEEKALWIHFLTKMIQTVKILTPVLIALRIRSHLQDQQAGGKARETERKTEVKTNVIQKNKIEANLLLISIFWPRSSYRIAMSTSQSCFEELVGLFRLFLKLIFDPYVLVNF